MPALVSVRKLNPGEVAVQVTVVTKQSLKDARVVLNGVQAPIAPCVQMCKINNGAFRTDFADLGVRHRAASVQCRGLAYNPANLRTRL